jgi:hypothetical protein
MREAAMIIKAEAAGKVCSDCVHATYREGNDTGWCSEGHNVEGERVKLYRRNAVACGEWVEREETRPRALNTNAVSIESVSTKIVKQ